MSARPNHAARVAFLSGAVLLAGCGSKTSGHTDAAQSQRDLAEVESWVKPQRWPGYWTIWADVRDVVGAERWAALDTSWMEERARFDLAAVDSEDDYGDLFVLSGLWRLDLLREEVLAAFAAREPDVVWPLVAGERGRGHGWRLRVERWVRAQPDEGRDAALTARLDETWNDAVAVADLSVAARLLEARGTRLRGVRAPPELRTAVERLVRASLDEYLREFEQDWRDGRPPRGVIALMERFGVPSGVDLEAVVAAAERYDRELTDAVIPLPHPYDLHVRVLRLQRLRDAARD